MTIYFIQESTKESLVFSINTPNAFNTSLMHRVFSGVYQNLHRNLPIQHLGVTARAPFNTKIFSKYKTTDEILWNLVRTRPSGATVSDPGNKGP